MKKSIIPLVTLLLMMMMGCQDKWEDRIDQDMQQDLSVWELLKTKGDYSQFVDLVKETGYDSILQRNAAYTVFAVPNSNMEAVDELTDVEKSTIVAFHLSNSVLYSSHMEAGTDLKTLNGKVIRFARQADQIQVDEQVFVETADIQARNGVIHDISGLLNVKPNILDYIYQSDQFSHIADYFRNNTQRVFDEQNSIPVDIDSLGRTVYDTVWRYQNSFFDQYADLLSEDKEYSIFLADDQLLENTKDGAMIDGYFTVLSSFTFPGILEASSFGEAQEAVDGREMEISQQNFSHLAKASNGEIYELSDLAAEIPPYRMEWEITDLSDFDPYRGEETHHFVDLDHNFEPLENFHVYDVEGHFNEFQYDFHDGARNGDYLRIVIEGGTSAKIDVDLPYIVPGKYKVATEAMIRAGDGLIFDTYFNDNLMKEDVSLNWDWYYFKSFDLGTIEVTEGTDNTLTMAIQGDDPDRYKGYIDYLIFEPIN